MSPERLEDERRWTLHAHGKRVEISGPGIGTQKLPIEVVPAADRDRFAEVAEELAEALRAIAYTPSPTDCGYCQNYRNRAENALAHYESLRGGAEE